MIQTPNEMVGTTSTTSPTTAPTSGTVDNIDSNNIHAQGSSNNYQGTSTQQSVSNQNNNNNGNVSSSGSNNNNSNNTNKNRNIIASHYQIAQKIGEGSFGIIFKGYDLLRSNQPVAIKFESKKSDTPQLKDEFRAYKILNAAVNNYYKNFERERYRYLSVQGIPKVYYFGQEGYYNILIIQLLGPSLEDLFEWCGRKFSIATVSRLAIQMVERIQFLHENNLIYRDIKPDNFLIGANTNDNTIYMVDYGMVKQYRDPITHVHIPYRERKSLSGTARYMSINTHLGREQSRRDDLESLGNVFVYFLKGELPWQGLKAPTNKLKYEKIGERKQKIPIPELCSGLPIQFTEYIRQVRSLKFDETPDYFGYINLFRSILENIEGTREYYEARSHEQLQQQQQQQQQQSHQPEESIVSQSQSLPQSVPQLLTHSSTELKSSELAVCDYDWMKLNNGQGWSWGKNKKINLNGYGSGIRHTGTQQTHLSQSQYNKSQGHSPSQKQQQGQVQLQQQAQQQSQRQQKQQLHLQQQQAYIQSHQQQPNSRTMSHSNSGNYYVTNGGNKIMTMTGKTRAQSTSMVNERTGLLLSQQSGNEYNQGNHNYIYGDQSNGYTEYVQGHGNGQNGGDNSNYETQNKSWIRLLCYCCCC
ncbi:hypothetical protein C6P40_004434 [Pichia californica]|uniref:non-specific serine/threonine protein kinase n=1 Tax=Pichia californica TaxID=460514 RepID=A0A9P6WRF6_9ASCO|nr:hypothetical protein C6P42_005310 [[Candida] californica]KAG0691183.1 hypothetical protein C6P40_004434 [[Candida] californica]